MTKKKPVKKIAAKPARKPTPKTKKHPTRKPMAKKPTPKPRNKIKASTKSRKPAVLTTDPNLRLRFFRYGNYAKLKTARAGKRFSSGEILLSDVDYDIAKRAQAFAKENKRMLASFMWNKTTDIRDYFAVYVSTTGTLSVQTAPTLWEILTLKAANFTLHEQGLDRHAHPNG
jgi:hypothetical protein